MKAILLTSAVALIQLSVFSQTQGPYSASNFTTLAIPGSSSTWTNLSNAGGSDNQYASFTNLPENPGEYTDFLVAKGFNFNIPMATIIKGIIVEIEGSDPNKLSADYQVQLNLPGSEDKAIKDAYKNYDDVAVYGHNSDLWGESLNYSNINDPEFGVKIAVQRDAIGGTTLGQIDDIRIMVYYSFIVLPVHLISFSANKDQAIVKINWSTSDESGMDHFEVQRSSDGRNFSTLNNLPCRNQSSLSNYAVIDNSPFKGLSYYRLKMVDVSGDISYSGIVSVHFYGKDEITIYPNPVSRGQKLFIMNPAKEEFKIQFYNLAGKLVETINTSTGEVPFTTLQNNRGSLIYRIRNIDNEIVSTGRILIE